MEVESKMVDSATFLCFRNRKEYYQIPIDSILTVKSSDKYTIVNTTEGKYITLYPLKNIVKHLVGFIKVGKSLAINRFYLRRVSKCVTEKSKYEVIMSKGDKILISTNMAMGIFNQL